MEKVMRVCITCLNLINYSGSERVIYELCKEFEIKGIEVHIACVNVGEFYYKELSKFYITNNSDMLDDEYDLIINFHWPSFPYFFKDGIFVKKNIHFSLSPFEEIEFPLLSENLYDLILCNSIETSISIRNLFESSLIKKIELSVFPNSINIQDDFTVLKLNNNKELIEIFQKEKRFKDLILKCEGYYILVKKENLTSVVELFKEHGYYIYL